jgi:hypothetical protein
MISYPGNSADINATRIYWDGTLVDSPGSSLNGIVSTVAGNDLRIGSSIDGTVQMSGSLDEVRLSHLYRGPAWSKYEFENQKMGGELLTYDLEYQLPSVLYRAKHLVSKYEVSHLPQSTLYLVVPFQVESHLIQQPEFLRVVPRIR